MTHSVRLELLSTLVCAILISVGPVRQVKAQYLFIDANEDGQSSPADRLSKTGKTSLDIWIQTDRNRDGTAASLGSSGIPLSIFSYSLALQATGGTVKWGPYANAQPSMIHSFGQASSPTEFFAGYGGVERLAPGRYKLGTLTVQVLSGDPAIGFIPVSAVQHGELTGFGSVNHGRDDDNTLKLVATETGAKAQTTETSGDWTDADGVLSPTGGGSLSPALTTPGTALEFGIRVGNGGAAGPLRFSVTTTKDGPVRVRLFDVNGRLVRTLASEGRTAGTHLFEVSQRASGQASLGNGIYFYRVEAPDGALSGKVVLLH